MYGAIKVAIHIKNMAPERFWKSLGSGPALCQNAQPATSPKTTFCPTLALNTSGFVLIADALRLQMDLNYRQQPALNLFLILTSPNWNF